MAFFNRRKKQARSIDDLIVLREFRKAEDVLRISLKEQNDPKLRMKLGDVLGELGRGEEAVTEYVEAADELLANGFADRAHASLMRARKLSPQRADIEARLAKAERSKRVDGIRSRALQALRQISEGAAPPEFNSFELGDVWEKIASTDWVLDTPSSQLERILSEMEVCRIVAGKRIVAEGALDRNLLMICDGEAEARRIGPHGVVALRTFQAGDVVGERSLLDGKSWPVTLVASADCIVLRLTRTGFERALVGNPDPRGLIDSLRAQGQDKALYEFIAQL